MASPQCCPCNPYRDVFVKNGFIELGGSCSESSAKSKSEPNSPRSHSFLRYVHHSDLDRRLAVEDDAQAARGGHPQLCRPCHSKACNSKSCKSCHAPHKPRIHLGKSFRDVLHSLSFRARVDICLPILRALAFEWGFQEACHDLFSCIVAAAKEDSAESSQASRRQATIQRLSAMLQASTFSDVMATCVLNPRLHHNATSLCKINRVYWELRRACSGYATASASSKGEESRSRRRSEWEVDV